MKDININCSIFEIEHDINENVENIKKGRTIDELSTEELIELNEMYESLNKMLEERLEVKQYEIERKKKDIRRKIDKLKNN